MSQLKRVKYVSEFAAHLTSTDIEKLVSQAAENNIKNQITGILVASGHLFFQVIEGPADAIDTLFENIKKDKRHNNVLLLNSEHAAQRIFPDWALKRFDMNSETLTQMEPLKAILETITENRMRIEQLTRILERAVWERFSEYM
jgi:hypothetical protein